MVHRHRSRREVLATAGGAISVAVAGCSGQGDEDEPPESDGDPASNSSPESTEAEDSVPDTVSGFHRGNGDDTRTLDVELFGPTGFTMEHSGSANFSVELYNSDGEQTDLLANEIGAWAGANLTGLAAEEHLLDISASGEWSIETTQHPIYTTDDFPSDWPIELESASDAYYGPVDFSDARTMSVTASGDGNNIVTIRNSFGVVSDLAVNTIGSYEGSGVVSIPDNVGWIDAEMSGEFTIILEE